MKISSTACYDDPSASRDPFPEPRDYPNGWDMSVLLSGSDEPSSCPEGDEA